MRVGCEYHRFCANGIGPCHEITTDGPFRPLGTTVAIPGGSPPGCGRLQTFTAEVTNV